jgi:hypothetical protein
VASDTLSVDFLFDQAISSRRKVIEISKKQICDAVARSRLWLAIRTSDIPGRVSRKRLEAFDQVFT